LTSSCSDSLRFDHVGLPVHPDHLMVTAEHLEALFGATQVSRPSGIGGPGTWLTLDGVEVHLIARADAPSIAFGKTHSPHLCVRAHDISSLVSLMGSAGVEVWSAGTVHSREQLWALLAPSFVVEIQSPSLES
jgi:hypothetical protein